MSATQTIREFQTLIGGVKVDGVARPGGETDRAWHALMASDPNAPWPPLSGEAFKEEYSAALRDDYLRLYSTMLVRKSQVIGKKTIEWEADAEIRANQIRANQQRYGKVADMLVERGAAPSENIWVFIGIIHSMECDLDFSTHLANGDPLRARTVQVPRGLPRDGEPPFTWEHAALAALLYDKFQLVGEWTLPMLLFLLEDYNGWGYRKYHPQVLNPYLWSGSTLCGAGKYRSDGSFDPDLMSKEIGAAVLLHALGFRA